MRKILVAGAGNMGSWFIEALCLDYDVAIYDIVPEKLRYFFRCHKLLSHEEIRDFGPDLLINAVPLHKTIPVFESLLPWLPRSCVISDIASVKNGMKKFYLGTGYRYASTHPMFGPTFANLRGLNNESAIIISESDDEAKDFFRNFYGKVSLRILEYSFDTHDSTIAYSLSIPFVSSMVFAACMKMIEVPGTTFRKHFDIARGLMSEDDYLLSEILLNPYTLEQVERISERLQDVIGLIRKRDTEGLHRFFKSLKTNIGMESSGKPA